MTAANDRRPPGPYVTGEARQLLGVETTRVCDPVSLRHIKEYLAATDQWPSGHGDSDDDAQVVAPPLFVLAATRRVQPKGRLLTDGQYDDLSIPGVHGRSVLAAWNVEVNGLLRVGDVVTVTEAVVSIEEKQGSTGPLVIVKKRSRHTNQNGDDLAIDTQTIIYR